MNQNQLPSKTLQLLVPPTQTMEPESFWAEAPDDELVAVFVVSRSRDAMTTLVQRHGPMVGNLLGRMLSKYEDREEAFQATFVVLMQSAKRLRKRASVRSFLYGVAFRIAKRIRQRRGDEFRKIEAEGNSLLSRQFTEEDQSPFEQLSQHLQLESMDEELQRLPESMRAPIVEHYYSGLSVPQIADAMQLTVTAVEGRIKRGKQLLRNRLAVRGVSLSAAAAAIAQIPNPVSASMVDAWCHKIFASGSIADISTIDPSFSTPSLQQLIQGELSMQLTYRTSWVLWTTAVCGLSALGLGLVPWTEQGGSSSSGIAISSAVGMENEGEVALPIALAMAPQPIQDPVQLKPAESKTTNAAKPEKPSEKMDANGSDEATEPLFGKGPEMVSENAKESPTSPVVWTRPAKTPAWLREESDLGENTAMIREKLKETVQVAFDGMPLSAVMDQFSRELGINFLLDDKALEQESITPDEPVMLKLKPLALRNALYHILEPLQLSYVIDHDVLVITSKNASAGQLRTYDLSLFLPDNSTVSQLVQVIQSTVSVDSWQATGGQNTLNVYGSLLVVRAPETVHEGIEELLTLLSKQSPNHIRPESQPNPKAAVGGMGGMM